MPATINSNSSALTYAEEATLKVLPTTPVWRPLEPNSYSAFGGDLKTVAREPINASRQSGKGTITDLDVTAGFNLDFLQNQQMRLFQGFFFAKAREKAGTATLNGTQIAITAVVQTIGGTVQHFTAASGLAYPVGSLVKSRNFINPLNDQVIRTTLSTATALTGVTHKASSAASLLVADAAPAATAALEVVGFAMSGDVLLYGPGSTFGGSTVVQPFLQSTATLDFTTLGLTPGEYVYLGDSNDDISDTTATEYNFLATGGLIRNRGYCRIAPAGVLTHQLIFDLSIGSDAWALGSGTGGSCAVGTSGFVSLYFGTVIRNEAVPASIVRTTYTLQRFLGQGVGSANNLESISGAVPNELTFNVPTNAKMTVDMTFAAMDTAQAYLASLPGTYNALEAETAYNTSSNVYSLLLYIINTANTTQAPLFGFADDEKLTINNGAAGLKAIGTVGSFEASVGNFVVTGTLSCYFDDIAAQQAVRNNANVGLVNIFAKQNAGTIIDLPLLTLAMKGLDVVKDKPIKASITHSASPGAVNYTCQYNHFSYLPDSAIAGYAG